MIQTADQDRRVGAVDSLVSEVTEFFESGGRIARAAGDRFEFRRQQLAMALAVAKALSSGRHAVIEAPTGTGKSLAYLVPAALWALKANGRVVISTNTINLQEQLVQQEVPFVREKLGLPVRVSLVKGRQNYLCPRRLELIRKRSSAPGAGGWSREAWEIAEAYFVAGAKTRSDLAFAPQAAEWEKVCCSTESCLGRRCPYLSRCPFFQARAEAAKAHILITNHHLFFSDLRVRESVGDDNDERAVLPAYDCVVFDEAHNLEDVATEYLGASIGEGALSAILGSLVSTARPGINEPTAGTEGARGRAGRRRKKKGKDSAVVATFSDAELFSAGVLGLLAQMELPAELAQAANEASLRAAVDVERASRRFSEALHALALKLGRKPPSDEDKNIRFRITEDTRASSAYADVAQAGRALASSLDDLSSSLMAVKSQAEEWDSREELALTLWGEAGQLVAQELDSRLDSAVARLQDTIGAINTACLGYNDDFVYWLERKPDLTYELCAAPLDISQAFSDGVLERCHATVATSATLAAAGAGDLSFFTSRVGYGRLPARECELVLLDSPFDWPTQALAGVITDLPEPGHHRYIPEAADALLGLLEASHGRALVLFTSYRMLEDVFAIVEPRLAGLGIRAFRQGSAPRNQLLERFRTDISSVLFATDSFWEGVDVPGESLSVVILARLPFRVPTDPLIQARCEKLDRQGKNSFMKFTVPQAIIKFRQGVGRLIRTRSDRGGIIILDNRAATRPYGKAFLKALQPARLVIGPRNVVQDSLEKFLFAGDHLGATKK